jgi:hypothetical protein
MNKQEGSMDYRRLPFGTHAEDAYKLAKGERVRGEPKLSKIVDFVVKELQVERGVFEHSLGIVVFVKPHRYWGTRDEMKSFVAWLKGGGYKKKASHSSTDKRYWLMLVSPPPGVPMGEALRAVEDLLYASQRDLYGSWQWKSDEEEPAKDVARERLAEYGLYPADDGGLTAGLTMFDPIEN